MAQTLKFGNGNFATKAGSTLCYDDQNGNFKPIPMDFTRASTATRVNKQGLIEVVKSNVPRIDYTDTSDGVLLLENTATNLITYSEDFSNAYWTKNGLSTPSGFISPDGTANAFKLVEDTSTSHQMYKAISGTSKTLSFFAKSDGRDWIAINCGSLTYFNVALGIVGTVASGSSATIESMPNGWFKCSVTETSAAYGADFSLSKDGTTSSYQGDGTSGVLLWGVQLETGVTSSYIPTQGSASTRVAETASGSGNSEVFNDSEGVLFANIAALANDGSLRTITLGDNSSSNAVSFRYDNPNQITLYLNSGGASQCSFAASVPTLLFNKCLIKYKANDFSAWVNGFEIGVDSSGITFPSGTLDRINFDIGYTSSNPFYGKTKEIGYYNTILTDLELETLTSYRTWISMVNELNLNIIYNG